VEDSLPAPREGFVQAGLVTVGVIVTLGAVGVAALLAWQRRRPGRRGPRHVPLWELAPAPEMARAAHLRGRSRDGPEPGRLEVPAAGCSLRAPVADRAVPMTPDPGFALPPDRITVAAERCAGYTALSAGCSARRAFLTTLGVTTRFTARPGCTARRTLRGTSSLEKKPTSATILAAASCVCGVSPYLGPGTGAIPALGHTGKMMDATPVFPVSRGLCWLVCRA
jgi:hypothetical protein